MSASSVCLICRSPFGGNILHIGMLPACNRFQLEAHSLTDTHSLSMTACDVCGLVQLVNVAPIEFVRPRVSWIHYNEPEAHLDLVVSKLEPYLHKKNNSKNRVYGIGPFDQPMLTRLNDGFVCSELLTLLPEKEKNIENIFPYLETIQAQLKVDSLRKLTEIKEPADLVVCRYLLEHCHDPVQALIGMRSLIKEDGLLLIEVPDCTKFLTLKDYSFLWEEHVVYFLEATLKQLFHRSGFELIDLQMYHGQLEDALVALIKPGDSPLSYDHDNDLSIDKPIVPHLFDEYLSEFSNIKKAYIKKLSIIKDKEKKVVVFGAGHQAIMFINALQLGEFISFIVDDDVNKQGYFSPGSGIPIVNSSILLSDFDIDTCLLAVRPRLENRILEKFASFLQRGGKMYSIFPGSTMSYLLEKELCA